VKTLPFILVDSHFFLRPFTITGWTNSEVEPPFDVSPPFHISRVRTARVHAQSVCDPLIGPYQRNLGSDTIVGTKGRRGEETASPRPTCVRSSLRMCLSYTVLLSSWQEAAEPMPLASRPLTYRQSCGVLTVRPPALNARRTTTPCILRPVRRVPALRSVSEYFIKYPRG
jgi:hypothetical protein